MKAVDDYMKLPYRMEIVPDMDEAGFTVSFPDLPGCVSIGDTIDEAYKNALDAKRSWLETAIEDGISINGPNSIDDY